MQFKKTLIKIFKLDEPDLNGGRFNLAKFIRLHDEMNDTPAVIDARERIKRKKSLHNIQNLYTEQHRAVPYWTAHREFGKDIFYLSVILAQAIFIARLLIGG